MYMVENLNVMPSFDEFSKDPQSYLNGVIMEAGEAPAENPQADDNNAAGDVPKQEKVVMDFKQFTAKTGGMPDASGGDQMPTYDEFGGAQQAPPAEEGGDSILGAQTTEPAAGNATAQGAPPAEGAETAGQQAAEGQPAEPGAEGTAPAAGEGPQAGEEEPAPAGGGLV